MRRMMIIGLCMLLCLAFVSANDLQAGFGDSGDNQLYFGPGLTDNQAFFDNPSILKTTSGGSTLLSLSGNVLLPPNATVAIIAEPPPLPAKKYVGVFEGVTMNMALVGVAGLFMVIFFVNKRKK
jgi:hypothetical protein